jgi:hypothetical protein
MLKITYYLVTCGFVLAVFLSFERPAYAYVDPGSGLFLLQGIGTALAGVFFYIRRRLKALTGSREGLGSGSGDQS